MLRTALASLVLATASYAAASWLTHDFQVWTAEGARRLEVALQPVPAPEIRIEGPQLPAQPLRTWLTQPGRVTLVDFIYTRCETVCLSLGGVFQQLQQRMQTDRAAPGAGDVRLMSISFDGANDTPDRLADYAHGLGAQPDLWQFVRVQGEPASALLLRRFGVVVVANGLGDYEHNAAILVIDDKARLVRVFDISEHELALDYAQHLARVEAAASHKPAPLPDALQGATVLKTRDSALVSWTRGGPTP